MTEPLWIDQPKVLIDRDHLKKFVWLPNMDYNQKLNATARFILYFTLIAFLYYGRIEFIYLALAAMGYLFYAHYKKPEWLHLLLNMDSDGYRQSGGGNFIGNLNDNPLAESNSIGMFEDLATPKVMLPGPKASDERYGGSKEDWEAVYGPHGSFRDYSNELIDPKVIIDPASNQRCKVSTPDNPFGNPLPGDNEILNSTPLCDPDLHKEVIENNFERDLFSDINDVFQRNNSQRQYTTQPSTTIPNDREGFMTWCWETPYVCKDGDMDACFKQGY